jgi:hypothetical protein
LSQSICQRLERTEKEVVEEGVGGVGVGKRQACEYTDIMLPSIFILHCQQHLGKMVQVAGFQGMYNNKDLWEWLNEAAEGFEQEWQSNWIKT